VRGIVVIVAFLKPFCCLNKIKLNKTAFGTASQMLFIDVFIYILNIAI